MKISLLTSVAILTLGFISACAETSAPNAASLGSQRPATSRLPAASNVQGNALMNNYRMNAPVSPNQ